MNITKTTKKITYYIVSDDEKYYHLVNGELIIIRKTTKLDEIHEYTNLDKAQKMLYKLNDSTWIKNNPNICWPLNNFLQPISIKFKIIMKTVTITTELEGV